MRKSVQLSVLIVAAALGGCAQSSGLGGLSLLGGGEPQAEAVPDANIQLAVLSPGEMPPLPSRRPGKRRATPAAAEATDTAASSGDAAAEPAKTEGSGLSLASLNPFTATAGEGPDSILVEQPPVEAYSLIAHRIKYCWLNPSTPKLPDHGFHAEIAPGEVKEAKIVIYRKAEEGRRGTSALKVNITAESSGSLIATENSRLDPAMTAAFKADLARWAKGDDRCKA
jgi:hypothetical protein